MDLPVEFLPPGMLETYKEYKYRQKVVLEWLQQHSQAEKRQYSSQPSLTEFERLADEVSAQTIELPDHIFYSARTMLQMRKEVRTHYKGSHNGHDSCIVIFEKIVSKLARMPRTIPASKPAAHDVAANAKRSRSLNRFKALPPVQLEGLGEEYVPYVNDASVAVTSRLIREDQAAANVSTTESLSQPNTVSLEELQCRVVMLHQVSMALYQARSVCAKARDGKVPLYIAAYMVERAVLLNHSTMIGVWFAVCGRDTVRSVITDVEVPLRKAFSDCNEGMDEEFREKFGSLDVDDQIITPSKQLEEFFASSGIWDPQIDVADLQSRFMQNRPPYSKMLSDLTKDGASDDCMQKLIMDLNLNYFAQVVTSQMKTALSSGSRIIRSVNRMSDQASLPSRLSWANALHILSQTALSFEHGSVTYSSSLSTNQETAPNCRLKTLTFAQEVMKAIVRYMPPDDPSVVGYSTINNLEIFRARLQTYLEFNQFDLISQHPAFAGSDTLLILDTIYRFGFEQLAYENSFLGPLHVYNALQKLGILPDIAILEALCNKFLDAAFYGSRPAKKFKQAWKLLDDYFNISQSSRVEAKILLGYRWNGQMPRFSEKELMPVISERGQKYFSDSRFGYNKRMKANDYSMLHRIYNQDNDADEPISDATRCELFGEEEASGWRERVDLSTLAEANERVRSTCQKVQDKISCGQLVTELEVLEDALVREANDDFPLMRVNLTKVWHHAHSVFAKVHGSKRISQVHRNSGYIETVLRKCDDLAKEKRNGADGRGLIPDETLGWKEVEAWKTAFLGEFEGTVVRDFMWKNL